MVEARKMTDQFEAGMPSTGDGQEKGIASEGVIAYRVQTRNPTVQEREGNKKPLYLMTLTALQPGESAALDNGVTLTVTAARPDGFAIRIDDAGQHLIDRTATTGARAAAGPPCALVLAGPGIENIAYRDTAGHMNEIWRDPRGQGTTDLTANAGAPARRAIRSPISIPPDNQVVLIFRGADNHVRSLYWMFGAVGHDNLTGSINAPKTAGDPAGWFSTHDGFHHVVYRTGRRPSARVVVAGTGRRRPWRPDRAGEGSSRRPAIRGPTTIPSARPTSSSSAAPTGTSAASTGARTARSGRTICRASPGRRRRRATRSPGSRRPRIPTASSIAPRTAISTSCSGRTSHPCSGRDLTALSGAPPAAGNVSGGYNPGDNTQHVIFRSATAGCTNCGTFSARRPSIMSI